ncbi:hypothetical protein BCR33DRAFT_766952 [Rhizoclosmatium globosum]|uniref:Uncharacterized protein n=1 Tax=Rhizoclosmatium globosum TaxID=329046 RepID=A0A1Y2C6H4_9FUNG|nr:hypothetical protein BCR33DRAFT_766952 [Rhizoclosmatium globosum]|eukprot:ORY42484.1 hypothetical protein BCR33DRAFT_766952 [Rhizoclosmatium globosum]
MKLRSQPQKRPRSPSPVNRHVELEINVSRSIAHRMRDAEHAVQFLYSRNKSHFVVWSNEHNKIVAYKHGLRSYPVFSFKTSKTNHLCIKILLDVHDVNEEEMCRRIGYTLWTYNATLKYPLLPEFQINMPPPFKRKIAGNPAVFKIEPQYIVDTKVEPSPYTLAKLTKELCWTVADILDATQSPSSSAFKNFKAMCPQKGWVHKLHEHVSLHFQSEPFWEDWFHLHNMYSVKAFVATEGSGMLPILCGGHTLTHSTVESLSLASFFFFEMANVITTLELVDIGSKITNTQLAPLRNLLRLEHVRIVNCKLENITIDDIVDMVASTGDDIVKLGSETNTDASLISLIVVNSGLLDYAQDEWMNLARVRKLKILNLSKNKEISFTSNLNTVWCRLSYLEELDVSDTGLLTTWKDPPSTVKLVDVSRTKVTGRTSCKFVHADGTTLRIVK